MKNKIAAALLLFISAVCSASAQTGKIIVPDGNSNPVRLLIADKQGKYLYAMDGSKVVMWDIKTGEQLYSFAGLEDADQMALSDDGTRLAIGGSRIICYNTFTGKEIFSNNSHYYSGAVAFSANGSKLYSISNGPVEIDLATGKVSKELYNSFDNYHAKTLILPNGQLVLSDRKGWQIWDPATGKITFEKALGKEFSETHFLPTLGYVVFEKDNDFEFYNLLSGTLIKKLTVAKTGKKGNTGFFPSAVSDEFVVTAGEYEAENHLVYSAADFMLKKTIVIPPGYGSVFFQGSKKPYFTGTLDQIHLRDLASAKPAMTYNGKVIKLGFISPSYSNTTGKMSVISQNGIGKIIDMTRMVTILNKKLPAPDAACFSSSGDTVALFDYQTVTIRNIRTGAVILPKKPIGLTDPLFGNAFFFSNNGRSLYYLLDNTKTSGRRLMKMDMTTKAVTTKVEFSGLVAVHVTPDKKELEVLQTGNNSFTGCIINIETGKTTFERAVPRNDDQGNYNEPRELFISLSRDKKSVLFAHQDVYAFYNYPSGSPTGAEMKVSHIDKFGTNAASSDLSHFILGDRLGGVEMYNASGKRLYKTDAHISGITDIMFSPDNKVYYTFSYDQTIKTWNTETGELLGTLYLFNDGVDYVFVNADGRFDGTPEGIKRLYYFDNRQKLTLDVVYERFYTPNLYARLLAGERFAPVAINLALPPRVKITYAATRRNLEVADDQPIYQNTTGSAEITVTAVAPEDAIDEIRLFHNGKIITLTSRNLIVTDAGSQNTVTKKYNVSLLPGANTFRAVALNTQRTESAADLISVVYQNASALAPVPAASNAAGGPVAAIDKAATLHLIVVGINAYNNSSMSLNYALADATAFKNELEKDAKTVLGTVKTYFVTDKTADKGGIMAAFKVVQQSAKPADVFVFYYAGHGVIGKDKEFYLVPADVSDLKNVQTELEQRGIPSKLLQQYAIDIQAQKQLFILDACQSAGAFEAMLSTSSDQQKSLAVVARSTGTHWMAASGAQQFANEFAQLGHGAFTYVLLKAMKGEAAANKMITVNGLKNFLQLQVPDLMKKYNGTPQYPASYGFGSDFPVQVLK